MTGLEVLAAAASAVSGVIGAVGAIQSANAQAAAAEYNARVQEKNAQIADQNRAYALQTADIAAEDKAREQRRTLATIRAAYGSSGLEMAGSPLDVLTDTAYETSLDVSRTAYEGRVKARDIAIGAESSREQANLYRMEGSAAKSAGTWTAAGYLVGGVGKSISQLSKA